MQTMNISLPDQLKNFVDHQVSSGRYSSVSEYIRELIRGDEKRDAERKLESMILEGLQSGPATELTAQDWAQMRAEALRQFERRRANPRP
ncbi:MAG: type II toxin-antitoxin system ParD family antitoxin [Bryobacterales bacterium]|nr:type II toxin-antitoxin system ParD family antitoxin [Bryobacterales bacterium]